MVSFKLTHELPPSLNNNNNSFNSYNYNGLNNPLAPSPSPKHTRRLNFSETPSWNDLANKIDQLFFIPVYNVAVTYFDSDGDEITLSTEEEYIDFALSRDFKKDDVNVLGVKDLKILRDAIRPSSFGGYNYQPAPYVVPPAPYSPIVAPTRPAVIIQSRASSRSDRCHRARPERSRSPVSVHRRSRSRSRSTRRSVSRSRSPSVRVMAGCCDTRGFMDRRSQCPSPRTPNPLFGAMTPPGYQLPPPLPASPPGSHIFGPSTPIHNGTPYAIAPSIAPSAHPSPQPLWRTAPVPAFPSRPPSTAPSSLVNVEEPIPNEGENVDIIQGLKALLKVLAPDASVNAGEETLRKLIRVLAE